MKIVYLAGSRIPSQAANSVHVMKMCAAFAALGHDVTLIPSLYAPGEAAGGEAGVFDHYGVKPDFRIRRPPARWIRNRSLQGLAMALLARLRGADLVFGRHLTGCLFSAALGVPTCYETHDDGAELSALGRRMVDAAFASARVRRVIVISEPLRRIYAERYPARADKLLVAHDGADEGPTGREWRLASPPRGFKVGYIGHLYKGRGVELILELARRCDWATFYLVGGRAEDVAAWREAAAALPNVSFEGFRPPGEVERLRSGFDALIAPYQHKVAVSGNRGNTAAWMSPLKVFEYMSSGAPIIASDLPALREILTDGEDALLCDPERPEGWETALRRLRDEEGLGTRLAETALGRFRRDYTWRARAERLLEGAGAASRAA